METIHPARRVGRLIEIGKDAPRPIEEHRAGVGRRDAARRPEQQLHPEPILETRHDPRDRGLRQAQLAGDLGEAASFGCPDEDGEFLKPITHT